MINKYGRNINYLRISLTDKCNLKCVYCMPEDSKRDIHYENLSLNDFKFIIKSMSELGITKVRFTGGEPLLYPELLELIRFTREECNIEDIGLTTNGIMLYEIADKLKAVGLNKVNISLDSLKEYKYKSITRGGLLKNVLKSIELCLKLKFDVKINCVGIDGFNDDEIYDFIMMTKYYPIHIRFIELVPTGEAKYLYKRSYLNMDEIIKKIEDIIPVEVDKPNMGKYYKLLGAKGKISVISPKSTCFCKVCNSISFNSLGKVRLCKYSEESINMREYMQKPLMFRETMKEIMLNMPGGEIVCVK